jgi:alpha-amylase
MYVKYFSHCHHRNNKLICTCSYYSLIQAFSSTTGNISALIDMHNSVQNCCRDTTLLPTFASNHDNGRLAALSPSLVLRKNALAYTFLADGIPTLYQGDEQGFSGAADPENREAIWLSGYDTNVPLYTMVRTLNQLRAWAGKTDSRYWASTSSIFWNDSQTLAMRKGCNGSQVVTVLTNRGDGTVAETKKVTDSGFAAGTILVEVIACEKTIIGHDGVLNAEMAGGNPKVFIALNQLLGSTICQPWLSSIGAFSLSDMFLMPLARLFSTQSFQKLHD